MNIRVRNRNGSCKLKIEGEMTIYNAQDLKKNILGAVESCKEIELDLSDISEMDTSGFQLLLLARREAGLLKKNFRISSLSQPATQVLELYNMKDYLGDASNN